MKIRQIKETCLYVSDLNQTESFYSKVLELPVIGKKQGGYVFFKAGSSVLLCFNPEDSGSKSEIPAHWTEGTAHLAFEVSVSEYQQWKEKVTSAGVKIIHEHSWGQEFLSFYFNDPDGHVLEIVQEGMWEYLSSF
jgi:catechol 2,3-dioxygenase-like lactoylglutathione lyase family enzyme